MPWEFETFQKKRWYHSPWPWVAVTLVLAAGIFGFGKAKDLYHTWNEKRRVIRAVAAFEKGDDRRAFWNAKIALAFNPKNAEALRIVAKTLERQGATVAAMDARRHLAALGGGNAEDAMALTAQLLEVGEKLAAERALAGVPDANRNTARFHELSARVEAANGDMDEAAVHWEAASKLEPAKVEYRLELAAARLKSKEESVHAAGVAELEKLRAEPATRLAASRQLLGDAVALNDRPKTLALSQELVADPSASFSDRLRHLTILHSTRDPAFEPLLAEMRRTAPSKPEDIYLLLVWLNEHSMALAVPEIAAQLPQETLAVPQVRAALADADARTSNWSALKEKLEKDSWEGLEFLRLAFLFRANERLGDATAAGAAWANAVNATENRSQNLEVLGKTLRDWGQDRKAAEILWRRARGGRCPRWIADFLWSAALKEHDTAKLYEASRLLLVADPRNVTVRNNHIALALLTRRNEDSPQALAHTLYNQEPGNANVTATYALSLFQQGLAADAAAVMKRLKPEQLREPLIALYYGIYLAGANRPSEAQEYLEIGATAPMLDEERALFEKAIGEAPLERSSLVDRYRVQK